MEQNIKILNLHLQAVLIFIGLEFVKFILIQIFFRMKIALIHLQRIIKCFVKILKKDIQEMKYYYQLFIW